MCLTNFYLESGPKGFYAKFPAGPKQNVTNGTQCTPSLKIEFICDSDKRWQTPLLDNVTAFTPKPDDISIDDNDTCFVIIFQ